jgi:hypothetical protein
MKNDITIWENYINSHVDYINEHELISEGVVTDTSHEDDDEKYTREFKEYVDSLYFAAEEEAYGSVMEISMILHRQYKDLLDKKILEIKANLIHKYQVPADLVDDLPRPPLSYEDGFEI